MRGDGFGWLSLFLFFFSSLLQFKSLSTHHHNPNCLFTSQNTRNASSILTSKKPKLPRIAYTMATMKAGQWDGVSHNKAP